MTATQQAAPAAATAPASAGQRQIWLAEQLRRRDHGAADAAYSTSEALAISGELDRPALLRALHRLAARHAALRTTFYADGAGLHQRIHPDPPIDIAWHDLGDAAGAGADDHAQSFAGLLAASLEQPFHLDQPPLWRALIGTAEQTTYMALVLHHVVADGWSVALLLDDLAALYLAAVDSGPEPATPARTYRLYSEETASGRAADQEAESVAYWQRTMRDAPTWSAPAWLGPSPSPSPSLAQAAPARAEQHFVAVTTQRYEAVRRLAAHRRATPYVVYLSAFVLALTRAARRRDVVTALPSANREDEEYFDVVGPFATLVPVRVRLAEEVRPEELIRLVADCVADASSHKDVPLADIIAAAGQGSVRTGLPLFQTVALPRDWREEERTFARFAARSLWTAAPAPKYHLVVSFPTDERDPRVVVEYDAHRYDRRMAQAFSRLFEAALADVLGEELIRVLAPPPARTAGQTIHERVAELARHAPDHPAVVAGGQWCSYAELDARARAVAEGLAGRGVRRGDRVGLLLGRGIEFVVAALACLHAGAAYTAVDPAWPPARVRQVFAEAAVAISIVRDGGDQREPSGVRGADGPVALGLTELAQPLAQPGTGVRPVLPVTTAGEPFSVCFTSGSTGRPKGTLIAHRSVLRLSDPDQVFALDWADRMAHQANIAFDATTWELWGALLVGATVVVGEADPAPGDYAALVADCTTAFLTTGLFTELVRNPSCRAAIAGLRVLGVGGSVLTPDSTAPILRAGRKQFNFYGPTECTATSTAGPLAARTPWGTVPVGPPIAGARAHVLDGDLAPVPDGEVGDLYLAGSGVALGYLGDPRRTAERFLPDIEVAGERMYATGDRARRLGDGALDYVARADSQLKIRGFRVEPGEIEAVLRGRPGVHEAYVGLDDRGRLTAAVRADQVIDSTELTEHVRAALPDYMVPQRVLMVDRLPLTRNGKVDVVGLLNGTARVVQDVAPPEADATGTTSGTGTSGVTDEAHGGLVGRVLQVWAEVLETPVAGDTEFFGAGGDSLSALRLLSRHDEEFGIELRPADLYAHSTPLTFAAVLAERMEHVDGSR